jgi:hypothetical protein
MPTEFVYNLGVVSLTTANTYLGTPILELGGMSGVSAQLEFEYGAGGTSGVAYVQSSVDQGQSWFDVLAMSFATSGKIILRNFTSGPQVDGTGIVPTDGAMPINTAMDGALGDRLRLKVVSTGTYTGNSRVRAWVAVR